MHLLRKCTPGKGQVSVNVDMTSPTSRLASRVLGRVHPAREIRLRRAKTNKLRASRIEASRIFVPLLLRKTSFFAFSGLSLLRT